ncbi:MAG: hypothetical protein NPMRD1_250012 [Nitrosopumilales archaeon]|nr:MAG: hypothetical protein NPMRD1_250012 [Nitrosopumilales archaeon]
MCLFVEESVKQSSVHPLVRLFYVITMIKRDVVFVMFILTGQDQNVLVVMQYSMYVHDILKQR